MPQERNRFLSNFNDSHYVQKRVQDVLIVETGDVIDPCVYLLIARTEKSVNWASLYMTNLSLRGFTTRLIQIHVGIGRIRLKVPLIRSDDLFVV